MNGELVSTDASPVAALAGALRTGGRRRGAAVLLALDVPDDFFTGRGLG
jgi:hypothetical protein